MGTHPIRRRRLGGNSNNTPMEGMFGSRGAGPIWRGLMEWMLQKYPDVEFVQPPGLVSVLVDATSGLLRQIYTPYQTRALIEGTQPQLRQCARPFRVCRASGKLATSFCPLQDVEVQTFEIYPPDASDWVRESQIPQPPTEYCDLHAPAQPPGRGHLLPAVYAHIRGMVTVFGNARPGDFGLPSTVRPRAPSNCLATLGGEHYGRVEITSWNTGTSVS